MSKPTTPPLGELYSEIAEIQDRLTTLDAAIKALQSEARPKWGADDSAFMIFNLGFTSGAHMARTGEAAPACAEIFVRCRELYMKTFPGSGPLSPEVNPS